MVAEYGWRDKLQHASGVEDSTHKTQWKYGHCKRLRRQPAERECKSAAHHIESNSDAVVGDDSQGNVGLLCSLIVAAAVHPPELVHLKEALLQLSEHIQDQVLFAHRQRGHVGTLYLHMQHTHVLVSLAKSA